MLEPGNTVKREETTMEETKGGIILFICKMSVIYYLGSNPQIQD